MRSLYVLGGQQRYLRTLSTGANDWYEYQKGVILRVTPETGEIETCVRYVSPPEACAEQDPVILFKSGTLHDNLLYASTQTEVIIYRLHNFEQIGYLSLPCFNDVHHVRPTPDGHLLVANTGLDMVLEVSLDGTVRREWNVLGEEPWGQFSKAIDYRKGISTKPHRAHPNYVFYLDDEIWATRFQQKDAICLTRPDRRIDIGLDRVHDGVLHEGYVYFTTVNGNIVIVNARTLRIEEIVDLNKIHAEQQILGWCRSIYIEGGKAWVGFSRLRPTKWRENVSWVLQGFKGVAPTHIACYDLERRRCITEINLETHGLNAVFSIFPVVNDE